MLQLGSPHQFIGLAMVSHISLFRNAFSPLREHAP
jgi:hypothetical protein